MLHYHGMLGGDWGEEPLNQANGGPCADPREFCRARRRRALFSRYLDYVVARWGHSPSLFAWELWNEVDLCPRFADADVVTGTARWRLSRAIDPYHHPITTSIAWHGALPGLWKLPDLAFIQSHAYGPDLAAAFDQAEQAFHAMGKPLFIGEIGRGTEPRDDLVDPEGRLLHHALWQAWMHDFAGGPMPWWWDTHIAPNHLLAHVLGFSRFIAGEDRRGRHFVRATAHTDAGLQVEALVDGDLAYAYCYRPELIANPPCSHRPPMARRHCAGAGRPVAGHLDHRMVGHRARRGGRHRERRLRPRRDARARPVGEAGRRFALKLRRAGAKPPSIRVR